MSRRTRLLIAVAGVGFEVLVVLLTHPAEAPPWRTAISAAFGAVGLITFTVVGLAALRDNARSVDALTASRRADDPFRADWRTR